jgi:hypothetical protein
MPDLHYKAENIVHFQVVNNKMTNFGIVNLVFCFNATTLKCKETKFVAKTDSFYNKIKRLLKKKTSEYLSISIARISVNYESFELKIKIMIRRLNFMHFIKS